MMLAVIQSTPFCGAVGAFVAALLMYLVTVGMLLFIQRLGCCSLVLNS